MATPISNDNIPSSTNPRAGGPDGKSTDKNPATRQEDGTAAPSASGAGAAPEDTVSVGRAAQLYRSAGGERAEPNANLSSPEQAGQLAARISGQLAGNAAQALRAQAGTLPDQIGALLNAAP